MYVILNEKKVLLLPTPGNHLTSKRFWIFIFFKINRSEFDVRLSSLRIMFHSFSLQFVRNTKLLSLPTHASIISHDTRQILGPKAYHLIVQIFIRTDIQFYYVGNWVIKKHQKVFKAKFRTWGVHFWNNLNLVMAPIARNFNLIIFLQGDTRN